MRSEDTIARLTAELRDEMLREARTGKTRSLPQTDSEVEVQTSVFCRLRLELIQDPATTCTVSFTGETILGRSEADGEVSPVFLMLDTEQLGVSRQHAKLHYADGALYLLDLNSTNGTRLNGRRLGAKTAYPVTDGDTVALGWLEFTIHLVNQPGLTGQTHPILESRHALLSMIVRAIGAQRQMPALLQKLIEIAQSHTPAQWTGIWFVDEISGELYLEGDSKADLPDSTPPISQYDLPAQAIRQAKTLRDNRAISPQAKSQPSTGAKIETLYIPLMAGVTAVGVLSVRHRHRDKSFLPIEVETLQFMADVAAIAIQNLKQYQAARQDQFRLDKAMTAVQHVLKHDIRRLVNGIVGNAGLLQGDNQFDPYTNGILDDIVGAGTRLLDVADRLSSMASLSQHRLSLVSQCDLLEYVDQLLDTLSDTASAKGIRIATQSTGKRYLISGDAEYLILSLHSLLDNAIRFSPEGGVVQVNLFFSPQNIVLRVSDSGPGIREDILPDVVKSYLHNHITQEQPIGLGLEMVRLTVEAHMGTLHISNRVEGGTEVIVTLPGHLRCEWTPAREEAS